MRRLTFADICRRSRLREIKRVDEKGGVILIADSVGAQRGFVNAPDDKMYFQTVWAFGRNEDLLEASQPIFFTPMFEHDGLWRLVDQKDRVDHAEEKAREWLQDRDFDWSAAGAGPNGDAISNG